MAVAVQLTRMVADTGLDVHPFFTAVRNKSSQVDPSTTKNIDSFVANSQIELRSPADSVQSTRDLQSRKARLHEDASAEQHSLNASLIQNPKSLRLVDRVITSEFKQASRNPERSYKNDRKQATGHANVARSSDRSLPMNVNGESLLMSATSPDIEVDLNGERRKRRRTASVEPEPPVRNTHTQDTWEEQLQATARFTLTSEDSERDQSQNTAAAFDTRLLPGADFLVTSEMPQNAQAVEIPASPSPGKTASIEHGTPLAKNETPKKKMLKLRNDGRLASPRSRKVLDISRPNAKARGRRRKETTSSKLLILRYGSDSATKQSIGQSINSILEGLVTNERPSKFTGIAHVDRQPSAITKATHPFFLSKAARQTGTDIDHDAKSAIAHDEALSKTGGSTSPRKEISIVAPTAAKAWAAIAGQRFAAEAKATSKQIRIAGAMDPLWPPKGLQHCRGLTAEPLTMHTYPFPEIFEAGQRRMKTSEPDIHPGESILDLCCRRYYGYMKQDDGSVTSSRSRFLRKPYRRLMTGLELQKALLPRLASWNPTTRSTVTAPPVDSTVSHDQVINSASQSKSPHRALDHLYNSIATSLSGFDRFECETHDWTSKYMPRNAASVLQQGPEVTLLRDWLTRLTVMSVEIGSTDLSKAGENLIKSKRLLAKRRKRRKMTGDLEDFVVSSDSEVDKMDELAQPGTNPLLDGALRNSITKIEDSPGFSRQTGVTPVIANAVVISGPPGCGKTAAVHAVARELGFEVFEINAGSRRSGRDVLDRVGDMTRNHLVQKAKHNDKMEDMESLQTAALQEDISSGRQSTMQSFLKQDTKTKPLIKSRGRVKEIETKVQESPKKKKQQKQSLILLEEVDVLFDEDKLFWTTILSLILQSRRPIVMTCTDATFLPLDDMLLHAIFRFVPPPDDLAVDYLMLIAGNEGHLLSREATATLYRSKQRDIRASITELNFWCQMAVGDAKGGLEWMLIRDNVEKCHNVHGQALRVVSDGTYTPYMGFLSRDWNDNSTGETLSQDITVMAEALLEWDHDIEEWYQLIDDDILFSKLRHISGEQSLQMLNNFDLNFDAQSAADVLHGFGLRHDNNVISS